MSFHRVKAAQDGGQACAQWLASLVQSPDVIRQKALFFAFFAREVYGRLEALLPELATMYNPTQGRPALNPARLLGVLLLQFVQRCADMEAAMCCQFDSRWRTALHMRPEDVTFHPSLLTLFRQRLIDHDRARVVFEEVLAMLVEGGWVQRRTAQRIDSSHVCALLRQMGRLECVRESLRLALEALLDAGARVDEFLAHLLDCYVERKYDFKASQAKMRKDAAQAGCDIQALLAWVKRLPEALQGLEAVALLKRVLDENYEVSQAEGAPLLNASRPPGGLQNPHEPQAQWCSKSTTGKKKGNTSPE